MKQNLWSDFTSINTYPESFKLSANCSKGPELTTLINTRQDWCVYWALWTNLHRMLLNPVMWPPHWEPLTHRWWIGQGEAGHWIANRKLSSYLSQQASISLILESLYLIEKPINWPLFVTVINFFVFQKLIKILLMCYII